MKCASAALAVCLVAAPASAQHRRTNPPVDSRLAFESYVPAPPKITETLRRACYDCHSNETHWRWYSRLPFLSSLMVRHVERARRAMNLSEWAERLGPRPAVAASTLLACCVALQSGKMPKAPYGFFHPRSRLSVNDKSEFCEWSQSEAKRLFEQRVVLRLAGFQAKPTPQPTAPDVSAQRAAMKKLDFLVGKWSGTGRRGLAPSQPVEFVQTEQVDYRLDGLLLMIEGAGRSGSDGSPALQALGLLSYDDSKHTYHMRAFNDGRWLESDVDLSGDGRGLSWSFSSGTVRTNSVLRVTDAGVWTESHELTIGSQPPRKFMEITVQRVKPE